jgi:hypothetical protein
MNRTRHKTRWLTVALCCGATLVHSAFGQASANAPGSQTGFTNGASPQVPLAKSPVESFRELLAMPSTERLEFLAVRPPEIRTRILEKITEYESLDPEERQTRLKVTELRWYLLPLLAAPATNRAALLAQIPSAMRKSVEPRLRRLTILPPQLRQALLTNEQAVGYVIEAGSPSDPPPALTEDQRRKLSESFNKLLELTPTEKAQALRTLSDAERRQMEKTLLAFEKLPQDRRDRCVRSFATFATLSAAEQQEFLKNAERWSQMSLAERQTWNELVSLAPSLPPLPPLLPRKRPPYPHAFPVPVATNGK